MLNSHSLTVLRATCADTIPKILRIPKIPVQTKKDSHKSQFGYNSLRRQNSECRQSHPTSRVRTESRQFLSDTYFNVSSGK